MDIRRFLFRNRSYTPIPLLLAALLAAKPSALSILSGLIVGLCGSFIRLASLRFSRGATRTTSGVGARELVTSGPYGLVRNPLYIGNFFMSLGLVVMAWPWMPWFLLIHLGLFALQYHAIVSLEEEFLAGKFGEHYLEYKANVPRWIPRLKGWAEGDREPAPWRRAVRIERRSLQSFTLVTLIILLIWIL